MRLGRWFTVGACGGESEIAEFVGRHEVPALWNMSAWDSGLCELASRRF